jgi:hypothetical protein
MPSLPVDPDNANGIGQESVTKTCNIYKNSPFVCAFTDQAEIHFC